MKRKIYQELLDWKKTGMKKPLMIIGARQIGKTYIVEKFAKDMSIDEEYETQVFVN